MLGFRQYIKEYLTPEQHARYRDITMTPDARKATDHFFGPDNDMVREPIKGYDGDKSEVHKAIEKHVGHEFSIDEYKAGMTRGPSGKKVTIPSLITDKQLKHQFSQDNTRTGKGVGHTHYMTIVRGTEVAGQTNLEPDAQHPRGHSWGEASCKNVETGCNNHYLPKEIEHGTVVVRAHDPQGQEIYRATLQPHHDDDGNAMYALDSEYGLKHPMFTAHAHDVAKRLSGEYKPGIFVKHDDVYDDSGHLYAIHPQATSEQIHNELTTRFDRARFKAAAAHPNTSSDDLIQIADQHDSSNKPADRLLHATIAQHPNLTSEHVNRMLANPKVHSYAAETILNRPDIDESNISAALKHGSPTVRLSAIGHAKATPQHIIDVMNDSSHTNAGARSVAVSHPAIKGQMLDNVLDNEYYDHVRAKAFKNPNIEPHHIDKGLNDYRSSVAQAAIKHPKATHEQIQRGIEHEDPAIREAAISNPNLDSNHINHILEHGDVRDRFQAINHPAARIEHFKKAINDSNRNVQAAANERLQAMQQR